MSGVIPNSIITVSMPALPYGYTSPYRMISFPSRVQVLGVSFTVDSLAAGNPEDERVFTLSVMKGCKARGEGATSDDEDYVAFFGNAPKPMVTVATSKYLSTIAEPVLKSEWTTWGATYTADVAQMDTDEYLTVFVFGDTEGDYTDLTDGDVWGQTSCTVSISYTGATNYG